MKPIYLRLKGSKGIKSGMGLDEISIDFTKFQPGIIAIQGDNGTGKSTIMKNCHAYLMITGSKKKMQEHFMLRDSEKEFIVIQDGIKYRTLVLIDAKSEKAEAYIYEYLPDGTQKPLNNGLLGSYTEQVEKIFGSAEIFENVLNSSRKLTPITQMKPMDRKKIFYHFLGSKLTVFEEYDKIAKKRYDESLESLNKTRTRISFIEEQLAKLRTTEQIQGKLSDVETNKSECLKKIDELKKKIQFIDEQLTAENHKLSLVDETEKKIKDLEESIKSYQESMTVEARDYTLNSNQLNAKKSELESEIARKEKILANEAGIKKALEEIAGLRLFLNVTVLEAKTKKAEIEKEISQLNLDYQTLKSQYDAAVSEITNRYDKQITELEKEFTAKKSEYQLKISENKGIKIKIENKYQKWILEEEKNYSDTVNEHSKQQQEIKKLELEKNSIEKEIIGAEILFEQRKDNLIKNMERAQRNAELIDRASCTALLKTQPKDNLTYAGIEYFGNQCSATCELLKDARLNRDMIGAIASEQITLQNQQVALISGLAERVNIKESEIQTLKDASKEPDRKYTDDRIKLLESQRNDELSEVLQPDAPDEEKYINDDALLLSQKRSEIFKVIEPEKPDTLAQDMELSKLKEIILKKTQQRMRLESLERQGWENIKKEFDEVQLILPEKKNALAEIVKQISEADERFAKVKNENALNQNTIDAQIRQLQKQANKIAIQASISQWEGAKKENQIKLVQTEEQEDNYNKDILTLNSELKSITEFTSERTKEESELSTTERKVERLAFIREGLSKNGIPALIIHNVGISVATIANEYLRDGESGLRINFDTLKPNKNGEYRESFEIGIRRGEDEIDVQDLSDGETCWVDESINKAMGEYLTDPSRYSSHKYESDYTDEKDGSLSPENKHIFLELMEKSRIRSNRYYSFMVTHTPAIWKEVSQRIHLSREHGIQIVS
jgi:DNA repair exonuclease SbcCD ATPase subunit